MKFFNKEFTIGPSYLKELKNKVNRFRESEAKPTDTVVITMVTTYGVYENNNFNEIVEDSFKMEILFENV